ncbi:probable LRR receptor-like serine threonine-kinase At3g47570 [Olea europaea subsp. europaea]|nr:probable LRR receptor-like serine threonine-kinase At3g47570 [Olea europaea subsp. europaea]
MLELGNNSFSGHVPMNLGNLQNLQYLGLAGNQLTNDPSLSELGFLTSLRSCRDLKSLVIGFNYFDTMLPKSFTLGNLSASLEKFEANSCGFKGMIPNEIGNLSNLILLDMGSNNLRGRIPETLGELKKMQSLVIGYNKLEGTIPVSFCNFADLYRLNLEENELSQEIPGCLGNLTFLRMVNLSFNGFTSTIPSAFWTNKDLAIVDLSYNLLVGTLPLEIGSVTGMRELYLLGNQFSGNIPSTIWRRLQSLEFLNLAENKLHGHIPETFANLTALQYLDLSQNNLSGVIPKSLELLQNLVYFNISFNDLSGEIPNGGRFKNLTADSFKGNRELCGASQFKVIPCKGNKSSWTRFLKYIVPTVAFVVGLAIILLVCLVRLCKSSTPLPPQSSFPFTFGDERISYHEIVKATNDFGEDNLIDRGSVGSVYKGIFSNGIVAAIKVFDLDIEDANKSFDVECHIMSNIRHRNLVKVINSCCNLDIKALVLEYMPNGNLNKWLYSCDSCLDIAQRLDIMMNVACALEYLHHGYPSPIVHCDLKPSNILLDENMVARVGDFSIAKLFTKDQRISQTKTLGTIGYMAPEYGSTGLISTMADVYSYGILLMEVLTRKKPTDDIFVGELTMRRWVFESFPDAVMQIVDVDVLNREEENVNARESYLKLLMGLALECTIDLPEERLNMEEVVVRLKKIKNEFLS